MPVVAYNELLLQIQMLSYEQTINMMQVMLEKMRTFETKEKNTLSNSKTQEEKLLAKKAFDELCESVESINYDGEISLNGEKETAQALWRKYEGLD